MSKQKMLYEIKNQNEILHSGVLQAQGTSVFDMTEDVIEQISKIYSLSEVTFTDVSNRWNFEGFYSDGTAINIEFHPEGIHADKFGVDEELN